MYAYIVNTDVRTIFSIPFCPYHFVRYHFVLEPPTQQKIIAGWRQLDHSVDRCYINLSPKEPGCLLTYIRNRKERRMRLLVRKGNKAKDNICRPYTVELKRNH